MSGLSRISRAVMRPQLIFFGLLTIIVANAVLGIRNTEMLHQNALSVAHAFEALDRLANLRSKFTDIENGLRGFLLTGDEAMLEPYLNAVSSWRGLQERITTLVAGDADQKHRLSALNTTLEDRVENAEQIIQIGKERGIHAARPLFFQEPGEEIIGSIQDQMDEIEAIENQRLRQQQARSLRNYRLATASVIAISLLATSLLLYAWRYRKKEIASQARFSELLFIEKEWFRITLNSIGDGLMATDGNGNISMMNSIAEKTTGWREDEAKGKAIGEVFRLIDRTTGQTIEDPVNKVLATGKTHGLANHSVLVAKDGTERPVEDSAAPIRNANGAVLGVVFVFRDTSATEQTKRKLEISEARYRALVQASAVIVWTTSARGEVVEDSETWRVFTGQSEDQFKGSGWLNALHPADREAAKSSWCNHVNTREIFVSAYRLITAEGDYRYMKVRAAPVFDETGTLREWVAMNIDITESRRASEQLKESEARFRQIAQLTGDWIWEQEPSGRYVFCSPVVKDILGYTPQEMVGRHYLEFTDSKFENIISDSRKNNRVQERFFQTVNRYRHLDGHEVITESSGEPVISEDGEILKWRGVDRDITERTEADQRFRAIIESAPVAILAITSEGLISLVNGYAEKLFGFLRDELIGKPLETLIPSRYRKTHATARERYFVDPSPRLMGEGRELFAENKKGEEIQVEVALTPIRTQKGLVGVAMITDIRERRRNEEKLKQINRNQSAFLAYLGHELRNPLMPLRNAIDLLKDNSLEADRRIWAMGVVDRQSEDLERLVNDLLDVYRIAQGKISITPEPIELSQVIDRSMEATQALFQAKNQILDVERSEVLGMVNADPMRLAQVFTNVLNNASKYSDDGKTVWLKVGKENSHLTVSIRDQGIGIEEEDLPRIFDLFTSLERPDRCLMGERLGVGLTLAQQIIELHQGQIHVTSQGNGKGTEFVISLPSIPMNLSKNENRTNTVTKAGSADRCRILVVDDHPASAETLAELLKNRGFIAIHSTSGESALRLIESFKPDVLLLDIGLADMSGFDLAAMLRPPRGAYRGVIIAVSGFQQPELHSRADAAGFDEFIIKPIQIGPLVELIYRKLQESF